MWCVHGGLRSNDNGPSKHQNHKVTSHNRSIRGILDTYWNIDSNFNMMYPVMNRWKRSSLGEGRQGEGRGGSASGPPPVRAVPCGGWTLLGFASEAILAQWTCVGVHACVFMHVYARVCVNACARVCECVFMRVRVPRWYMRGRLDPSLYTTVVNAADFDHYYLYYYNNDNIIIIIIIIILLL